MTHDPNADRLGQLRELADWAIAHGAEISFG